MKTIKLSETEVSVLRQSLSAVGWQALPNDHPQRQAYETVTRKLKLLHASYTADATAVTP